MLSGKEKVSTFKQQNVIQGIKRPFTYTHNLQKEFTTAFTVCAETMALWCLFWEQDIQDVYITASAIAVWTCFSQLALPQDDEVPGTQKLGKS